MAGEAVEAARIGRKSTIWTGVLTTLAGIAGVIGTTVASCSISSNTLQSEGQRSATEFLRNQRQTAYAAFANEGYATYDALLAANRLFVAPEVPSLGAYSGAEADVRAHIDKATSAGLSMQLVSSDAVCEAAVREMNMLGDAGEKHVQAAAPYVAGKPVDDNYRKVIFTKDDLNSLISTFTAFTREARADLTDPSLRPPAQNCPK